MDILDGVSISELKIIPHPKGKIMHALKKSDINFEGFGEAYFSEILHGEIKGWKKHQQMVLNIVVPQGEIKFVLFDSREKSSTNGKFFSVLLGNNNYCRLTVPPGIWMAFQGVGNSINLLLNLASIEHHPQEAENRDLDFFKYKW
ncbi:dTDP-4-dehydrorhamnose 3,5-epimerase [Daejeonella rubra]|uniref:dTDP-4-dehydrorhamnose 3,5-epimerase n=1 Tax=Daejeonella rubra TaxID=990371 RepID=A0A1G9WVN8_9SPHI|nr:dTDP-4-dehydrorhamnose 3,5-epimerase family protein [Daejeonella rubra]SDM88694.1 dTDP-4-dehydrorhamnose 3,5-epimerase [Daejeonella rubra]